MIQMGKHADLSFLWIDYKKEHPTGYQLAQFYKLYRDFLVDTYGTSKTSMPVERIPGKKMYIDWVGDQSELLLDTTTGELRKVHIFTTTLGFSSLVYAEIFLDEKLPHFIAGTVHALSYYGAVPKYLVPDNLKTAVTRHSKDELVLQAAFSDLETFYDTIILPPPPRKPKGKPTVENHVRFLETHLVEELKKDTYTSLEALNAAVKKIVADINQRPFQKKSDIRKSRMNGFEKYDKPRMNQLPDESYTLCDYKHFLKVPDNYHLEYDTHYYSVLYTYKGKSAILKATMTEIRICDEYNQLICRHPRICFKPTSCPFTQNFSSHFIHIYVAQQFSLYTRTHTEILMQIPAILSFPFPMSETVSFSPASFLHKTSAVPLPVLFLMRSFYEGPSLHSSRAKIQRHIQAPSSRAS